MERGADQDQRVDGRIAGGREHAAQDTERQTDDVPAEAEGSRPEPVLTAGAWTSMTAGFSGTARRRTTSGRLLPMRIRLAVCGFWANVLGCRPSGPLVYWLWAFAAKPDIKTAAMLNDAAAAMVGIVLVMDMVVLLN